MNFISPAVKFRPNLFQTNIVKKLFINMQQHHLIFEGSELSGKSWLMSQIYGYLEPKYNQNAYLLDGCHWFNCDIGVYGTEHGRPVISFYLKIFQELKSHNLLVEKFHLSDKVYNRLYSGREIDYRTIEKKLKLMDFKFVLVTFPESLKLLEKRISDRLNLYPHYKRILHPPGWYIKQQRQYLAEIKESALPYIIIEAEQLPDKNLTKEILNWINEK